jgi:hypothetical protein
MAHFSPIQTQGWSSLIRIMKTMAVAIERNGYVLKKMMQMK